ncbi:hypothetical protein BU26DRAFT_340562 [Trematosphaeria pertusa]|uniref:Uncharacterized protein n=1 Tax=Trematosphaeria pertusa TaxID=390896 RepID=A0A6A6I901_9PLEO|nr:uncharacterized protein BU26DRAFT_340562 [Trematosphaeria pertusa]KAF2247045.1 hypothetical protein BU26DRAFT_340562 [Trematosphaeria pertusa]
MDFSNSAFRIPRSAPTLSNDTMSHTQMVQACRFGWAAGPNSNGTSTPPAPPSAPPRTPATTSTDDTRSRRLIPCRGRLYHQLTCSHRIRTDLVEDCGANCLEPFGAASNTSFYCQECVEKECAKIWEVREARLNALYPPIDQMTKDQYETWYEERRQLEAQFEQEHKRFAVGLKASSRPSNICSALEASREEMDFASELDSLSLSLMSSNDSTSTQIQPTRHRVSLPNDASEQLHWSLNSLAIDRGSCGVEYSASSRTNGVPAMRSMTEDELWRKPRERN